MRGAPRKLWFGVTRPQHSDPPQWLLPSARTSDPFPLVPPNFSTMTPTAHLTPPLPHPLSELTPLSPSPSTPPHFLALFHHYHHFFPASHQNDKPEALRKPLRMDLLWPIVFFLIPKLTYFFQMCDTSATCLKTTSKSSGTVFPNALPSPDLLIGKTDTICPFTEGETEDRSGEGICSKVKECVRIGQSG